MCIRDSDVCTLVPKVNSGILEEYEKNVTLRFFDKVNLNPTGDKKLRFSIWFSYALAIIIHLLQLNFSTK